MRMYISTTQAMQKELVVGRIRQFSNEQRRGGATMRSEDLSVPERTTDGRKNECGG